jgi:sugar lactone lactonase YvrE
MKEYTAEEWLPSRCGLGESPLYRQADDSFFFVDIKDCCVHSVLLSKGWTQRYTVHLDECVTRLDAVEDRPDLLAAQTRLGFSLLNPNNGALELIAKVRHEADPSLDDKVRMNDGGIDARGRWWASTMAIDEESKLGRLWLLDYKQEEKESVARDMSRGNEDETAPVINGIVWSPDDKFMYVAHTSEGKIFRYDYDVESGSTTNRRLFAQLEDGGMPDGLAVDVEGHVWAAVNSKGKLVRISPNGGEITAICSVPGAKMVSCPAFGGEDMKTLFMTSFAAPEHGSTGNVYRVRVDVPGVHRHQFKL